MRSVATAALFAVSAMAAAPASAVVIFSEDFEDEIAAEGGSALNYTGFDQFSTMDGTVDLVMTGDYGITCRHGSMGCVDLDGSTGDAGFFSTPLFFEAGTKYQLTFGLSGNQRVAAWLDFVEYGVLGVAATVDTTVAGDDDWVTYIYSFTGNGKVGRLFFANEGGDNIGAVIDNISVAAVPVPGALAMLGGALAGLGLLRRRRG